MPVQHNRCPLDRQPLRCYLEVEDLGQYFLACSAPWCKSPVAVARDGDIVFCTRRHAYTALRLLSVVFFGSVIAYLVDVIMPGHPAANLDQLNQHIKRYCKDH